MRPKLNEADVLRTVLDYLRVHRVFHWRANTGAAKVGKRFIRFGVPGVPDICCIQRGVFIGIEVKAPDGKLSLVQAMFAEEVKLAGGLYRVCRSIEDVDAALEEAEARRGSRSAWEEVRK